MPDSQPTLIFGKNGQLGRAFQNILLNKPNVIFLGRTDCDLTKADQIKHVLEKYCPKVIINASAYTSVDRAESEPELANLVNCEAPKIMAEYISKVDQGTFFHYSTDYVFDGSKEIPYQEDDFTKPLGQYGKSKLHGEEAIQKVFFNNQQNSLSNYYILRTSWVYGDGGNFIRTMLRLGSEREHLKVIDDQFGVLTSAEWLAEVSLQILNRSLPSGIYHAVPDGETSWYSLAKYAIECAIQYGAVLKVKPEAIRAIPAKEFPLPAPRPYNSRMNNQKLKNALQENFPIWENQVSEYVKNNFAIKAL